MEIFLLLAGLCVRFLSERSLNIDPALTNFIIAPPAEADMTVRVTEDWAHARLPRTAPVGEDAVQEYYVEGNDRLCMTKGGQAGFVAGCVYTAERPELFCAVNAGAYSLPTLSLGGLLRFLPMREIFLHFGVLFLHASQVAYRGKGILFSAPSGTGKTTQAKLWEQYRGAELVCNDRTLLRKTDGLWRSYGYPMDGSEPVRSSAVNTLGAVVLLEQGTVNEARRLRPGKAVSLLMGQAVIDGWNAGARTAAMELLLTLVDEVPVYLLTCTPDERAVAALEEKLTKEGVMALA